MWKVSASSVRVSLAGTVCRDHCEMIWLEWVMLLSFIISSSTFFHFCALSNDMDLQSTLRKMSPCNLRIAMLDYNGTLHAVL